ncbi:hypothetical protein [Streptomyces sp. NBC_01207]|uniref:hypothetical protein n=1 Tax=Streptomyces sp. NBC_01207 TaxID=2903772 RepID=UPI002E14B40C|nr:hypothetical protein OG457_44980 [Streptomyces sp. NBC_01207]
MDWYPLDALPDPMAAYCRAGLDAYRAGLPAAVHFQQPGNAIEYGPDGVDRTRLLAGTPVGEVELPYRLRVFAERAIGRIAKASEVSWGPDLQPGTEAHRARRRHLVPEAARSPPRPVAADAEARAVVVTVLPGRPLHGIVLDPADGARIQHGLGRLASALHRSAPERPADSATARRHAGTPARSSPTWRAPARTCRTGTRTWYSPSPAPTQGCRCLRSFPRTGTCSTATSCSTTTANRCYSTASAFPGLTQVACGAS